MDSAVNLGLSFRTTTIGGVTPVPAKTSSTAISSEPFCLRASRGDPVGWPFFADHGKIFAIVSRRIQRMNCRQM